jgi:hypothetical protein
MPTMKADEMGTYCNICLTKPSNIVLVPCNHLCICTDCLRILKDQPNRIGGVQCPLCRLDIDLNHQILIVHDKKAQIEKVKSII